MTIKDLQELLNDLPETNTFLENVFRAKKLHDIEKENKKQQSFDSEECCDEKECSDEEISFVDSLLSQIMQDTVTRITGTVVSVSYNITGVINLYIQPKYVDNKEIDGCWVPLHQCEFVKITDKI